MKVQKKILIIDNSIAFTGAFKCAFNEANLQRNDHKFQFLIPNASTLKDTLLEAGFTVHTLPMLEISKSVKKLLLYIPRLIKNGFLLRKIVKKECIDVVQVNDFYNLLGVFLKLTGVKIKLITNVRFLPSAIPGPLRKIWTFLSQKFSDKVICVSDAVLSQMPPKPNTIRLYDPVSFTETISEQALPHDDIRLLYIGNYIAGKGQNFALEAFEKAYQVNKNLRLQFAGGDMGLEKNKLFKTSLQNRVNALTLQDVVTFLPFVNNVEGVIKKADVVLNFSESESFSMTCLEASYYGRPVIATRCGGPEEIIDHEKTGLLVANRNVAAMTEGILKMAFLTAAERIEMGEAGSKYTKAKFSKQNFLTTFNEVIN